MPAMAQFSCGSMGAALQTNRWRNIEVPQCGTPITKSSAGVALADGYSRASDRHALQSQYTAVTGRHIQELLTSRSSLWFLSQDDGLPSHRP
jgi:hypothetical protein